MKVRLIIGANAYAVIEQSSGRRTDIRLSPGKSAQASLREYAIEQRDRAARILNMANLAEDAARLLEREREA